MKKIVKPNGNTRITSDKPCFILICDSEHYYREPFELLRGFCDIGGNAEVFETQAEAQTHIEENNLTFKVIEDTEI